MNDQQLRQDYAPLMPYLSFEWFKKLSEAIRSFVPDRFTVRLCTFVSDIDNKKDTIGFVIREDGYGSWANTSVVTWEFYKIDDEIDMYCFRMMVDGIMRQYEQAKTNFVKS